MKDEKKVPYDIPVEGSLGLLAVGYRGILLWREKREAYYKENNITPHYGEWKAIQRNKAAENEADANIED